MFFCSATKTISSLTQTLIISLQIINLKYLNYISLKFFKIILFCLNNAPQMQVAVELKKINNLCDYVSDKEKIKRFFLFYQEEDSYKYLNALRNLKDSLSLYLEDLAIFDETGLADRFENNTFSYIQLSYKVIDEILFGEEIITTMSSCYRELAE